MLKRQFCRTVAHYYVRTYGSEEYVERGNFWGYFPFNDPCIWRTLEGLAAVSMQEKANGTGPGVLTLLGTAFPLPRVGLVHPPMAGGPVWAGGRPWHGQVHRGSAPSPVMQLDFVTWWRRAAEHSMFLLVSVGVESGAASLRMAHAHCGASASSRPVTVPIVYNNWGFYYYTVINAL